MKDNRPHESYHIINPQGKEIKIDNMFRYCEKHGIKYPSHMYEVIYGKRKSCCGHTQSKNIKKVLQ